MLTVSKVHNAAQARSYYAEVDDYYREGGSAPTEWFGALAREYGFVGEVDAADFERVMRGEVGGKSVGKDRVMSDGKIHQGHRAGYDLTISAPKTASVLALVGGDTRLIDAHDAAVRFAFAQAEDYIMSRSRAGGSVTRNETKKMLAALFRHETNRDQGCQLHTHGLVSNITEYDGQLYAIDSQVLYVAQKVLGHAYQADYAARVQRLGFEIERDERRDSGWTSFAIKGVPEDLVELHSTRRQAILEQLAKRGHDGSASGWEREKAATSTRSSKGVIDHEMLRQRWRSEAGAEHLSTMDALIDEARGRASDRDAAQAYDQARAAQASVQCAAEILSERECRFSRDELRARSYREAIGTGADADAVLAAIDAHEQSGALEKRQVHDRKGRLQEGFTTRDGIKTEKAVLAIEREGRGKAVALLSPKAARDAVTRAAASSEYGFNVGQRMATERLLTSSDLIVGLQGRAGSAKTTTVIKTMADVAHAKGYDLVGLAQKAEAVSQLRDGGGLDSAKTIASFLVEQRRSPSLTSRSLIILDEASLVSAVELRDTLRLAEKAAARVLLVGDLRQLDSVGAGRVFAELQDHGMQTAVLDEIVRQRTDPAKNTVQAMYDYQYKAAVLDMEERGDVKEYAPEIPENAPRERKEELCDEKRVERYQAIADHYLQRDSSERANTLVVDPTRAGRSAINEAIQNGLKERGELGEGQTVTLRDRLSVTDREKQSIYTYLDGDEVLFGRDRKREGLHAETSYTVVGRDVERGTVQLRDESGQIKDWKPSRTAAAQVEITDRHEVQLHVGDRVQIAQNDKARELHNGDAGRVVSIDGHQVQIELDKGGTVIQDLDLPSHTRMRLAYAMTAHAAQGQTVCHVIAHLQSDRFADQKIALVVMTRARDSMLLFTDSVRSLAAKLESYHGENTQALHTKREEQSMANRDREQQEKQAAQQREEQRDSSAASVERADPAAQAPGADPQRHVNDQAGDRQSAQEEAAQKQLREKEQIGERAEQQKTAGAEQQRQRAEAAQKQQQEKDAIAERERAADQDLEQDLERESAPSGRAQDPPMDPAARSSSLYDEVMKGQAAAAKEFVEKTRRMQISGAANLQASLMQNAALSAAKEADLAPGGPGDIYADAGRELDQLLQLLQDSKDSISIDEFRQQLRDVQDEQAEHYPRSAAERDEQLAAAAFERSDGPGFVETGSREQEEADEALEADIAADRAEWAGNVVTARFERSDAPVFDAGDDREYQEALKELRDAADRAQDRGHGYER